MKMSNHKWYPILLLALSFLFATSFLACNNPTESGFVTYKNSTWEYAISYPSNWTAEVLDINTTEIRSPFPGVAHIEIYADESFGLPIQNEARIWLEGTMEAFGDVILEESWGPRGSWDWYLSYDYFLPDYDMTFHGEVYLKQTETTLYRVCVEAQKQNYEESPFEKVISTFTLLGEG